MGKIIRERERVTKISYEVNFYTRDTDEICSGYPCTENGELKMSEMEQCAINNYNKDLKNPNLYYRVKKWQHTYTENALFRCDCGKEFNLYDSFMGACDCPKCGQWYSILNGQKLNPVETWDKGEDW